MHLPKANAVNTPFHTREEGRGRCGIGDQSFKTQACAFANDARAWVEPQVNERKKVGTARSATAMGTAQGTSLGLYQRFPAEDVAVEADPVFREVESALKKNVSLECAGIICGGVDTEELRAAFPANH